MKIQKIQKILKIQKIQKIQKNLAETTEIEYDKTTIEKVKIFKKRKIKYRGLKNIRIEIMMLRLWIEFASILFRFENCRNNCLLSHLFDRSTSKCVTFEREIRPLHELQLATFRR